MTSEKSASAAREVNVLRARERQQPVAMTADAGMGRYH